jgi:anthranilate/para-aminobenzoate synthase component I
MGAEGALLGSPKERAEHAMIVDLVRNDLGRIAVPGSVATPRLFSVEPYAHLRHLVSVIEARLTPGTPLSAVLEATFPPASISGAPKIAALEHIEALEDTPRGFYTGALGGLGRDGRAQLAVAIRTAEVHGGGPSAAGSVRYFAGGGIVSASDPEAELAETELKARAFLDAVRSLSEPAF